MSDEVKYKCSKCDAEDSDPGIVTPPAVLNCWKCGAGSGLTLIQMSQSYIGMFPIKKGEEK